MFYDSFIHFQIHIFVIVQPHSTTNPLSWNLRKRLHSVAVIFQLHDLVFVRRQAKYCCYDFSFTVMSVNVFVYGCMHVCGYFLSAVECVLNPPWIWKWYQNYMNGGKTTEPPIIEWNGRASACVREKGRPRWKRSLFLHCFSSSFHEIHNHIMRDNRTNERCIFYTSNLPFGLASVSVQMSTCGCTLRSYIII